MIGKKERKKDFQFKLEADSRFTLFLLQNYYAIINKQGTQEEWK